MFSKANKFWSFAVALALAVALSGCGGGGSGRMETSMDDVLPMTEKPWRVLWR